MDEYEYGYGEGYYACSRLDDPLSNFAFRETTTVEDIMAQIGHRKQVSAAFRDGFRNAVSDYLNEWRSNWTEYEVGREDGQATAFDCYFPNPDTAKECLRRQLEVRDLTPFLPAARTWYPLTLRASAYAAGWIRGWSGGQEGWVERWLAQNPAHDSLIPPDQAVQWEFDLTPLDKPALLPELEVLRQHQTKDKELCHQLTTQNHTALFRRGESMGRLSRKRWHCTEDCYPDFSHLEAALPILNQILHNHNSSSVELGQVPPTKAVGAFAWGWISAFLGHSARCLGKVKGKWTTPLPVGPILAEPSE